MPVLEGFDFLRLGFDCAYRASVEPQLLRIDVTTIDKSTKRSAPIIVKRLIELINAGAACGSAFLPDASFAERVSGPWDGPDAFGPDFQWVLRVRAVSPLFLRTMIDQLRRCGHEQPVTTMRLRGELPVDAGALSVDTKKMRAWLDDPSAYVDECSAPGFSVEMHESPHTFFSVTMESVIEPAFEDALKHMAMRWLIATAAYLDDDGRAIVRAKDNLEKHLPAFSSEGERFTARFEEFLHGVVPSRAILVNMLAKMRAIGAGVRGLTIGHPRAGATVKTKAPKPRATATKKPAAKKKAVAKKPTKGRPVAKKPPKKKTKR